MPDVLVQIVRWLLIALSVGGGVVLMSIAEVETPFVCQARVPGGVCGATERHPANPKNQCVRGHFIVGSQQRLTHGARAFERHGAAALPDPLRTSIDDFRAQLIRDCGGSDGLTAVDAGFIRRLSDLETIVRLLTSDIATRGLFTPKGRVRSTHGRLLETKAQWFRYALEVREIAKGRQRSTLTLAARLAQAPVVTSETEDHDAAE